MRNRLIATGFLLFGSGMCALMYQIAWLRELRLVFGASTAASAAVLSIFMGGLGLGSAWFGKRMDKVENPLRFYALLELGITAAAFISPFLIQGVREAYIFCGGSTVMGTTLATVVRLLSSGLVLLIPTFLMGGTLPAAARSITGADDKSRVGTAYLYGSNTIGAVIGAILITFYMLELFGIRGSLWLACVVNLVVALIALHLSNTIFKPLPETRPQPVEKEKPDPGLEKSAKSPTYPRFVLFSSAMVGFAFFLMEMVWYRMLGPILGGSTYTFGLILVVALLGIGLGGVAYTLFFRKIKVTLGLFALSCALEAFCMAYPYALGDNLAIFTGLTRPLGNIGFIGFIINWAVTASIVILPAAFIAGIQFPLLIAILGGGGKNLGRQVGNTYAFNTLGAIGGSLAGGFGLLTLLSAPGTWVLVVLTLLGLGLVAMVIAFKNGERYSLAHLLPLPICLFTILAVLCSGPSPAWRYTAIGAGRAHIQQMTKQQIRKWSNTIKDKVVWEADGAESSVALLQSDSLSFNVNGKSDGNARSDASTQVMLGLVSAILHDNPKRSMVVGLGTGSSAGWLGAIPGMERVDTVEFEPVILEIARRCKDVNHNVMENGKVKIQIGDAREVLLTTPEKYDLIVSEPSNPYRAGIASLYTTEFYAAVKDRMNPGALFTQWLQGYEVDAKTVHTIYATLCSQFNYVETWQAHPVDLLFICSSKPITYDVPKLRKKILQEPYRSALIGTWEVNDLEGFLAHFSAGSKLATEIANEEKDRLNTDDSMLVEFGFARTVGRDLGFNTNDVCNAARGRGLQGKGEAGFHRPQITNGTVDWRSVDIQKMQLYARELGGGIPLPQDLAIPELIALAKVYQALRNEQINVPQVMSMWQQTNRSPSTPWELAMMGEAFAAAGDRRATDHILKKLQPWKPIEADFIRARLKFSRGRLDEAAALLSQALIKMRKTPWVSTISHIRAINLTKVIADKKPQLAGFLFGALDKPFAAHVKDTRRKFASMNISGYLGPQKLAEAIAVFEPHIPWTKEFLAKRNQVYAGVNHRFAARAAADLEKFNALSPPHFDPLAISTHPGQSSSRPADKKTRIAIAAQVKEMFTAFSNGDLEQCLKLSLPTMVKQVGKQEVERMFQATIAPIKANNVQPDDHKVNKVMITPDGRTGFVKLQLKVRGSYQPERTQVWQLEGHTWLFKQTMN